MKNKGVFHVVCDIKSILKNLYDDEASYNEGSLTEDIYEGILKRLDLILEYVDDIYYVYDNNIYGNNYINNKRNIKCN